MGKRLLQIFVLLFIYNILFCTDTTSLAKTKTINYQEEFPQYLQSAIVEQGIDKNSDGKLSGIEINAVTTLTLRQYGESKKYNSLKKITVFKNLKKLYIDSGCRVKNLKPLYSLKNLEVLEMAGDKVKNESFDFSKIKNLRVLRSPHMCWNNNVDLRNCKKLKTVALPAKNADIKVYLPDKAINFENIQNAMFKVYFCKEKQKARAIIFEKRIDNLVDVSYVERGKEYAIHDLGMRSSLGNKRLKSYVKDKNVKWKCINKDAKIKNRKVTFEKTGTYTIIGFYKNKRYVLNNINVIESDLEKLVINSSRMVITRKIEVSFATITESSPSIVEQKIINEVISLINKGDYVFDYNLAERQRFLSAPWYRITFYDENNIILRSFVIKDDVLVEAGPLYRGAKGVSSELVSYLESLILKGK